MRQWLAGALLALPLAAQGYVLTIDLSALVSADDYTVLDVYLRSEGVQSGTTLATTGFGGFERLRPTGATLTADLPASGEYPLAQHYVLHVQGRDYPFQMPARAASLQALLADMAEPGPCLVGESDPATTATGTGAIWCDPADGTMRFRTGGAWQTAAGGGGGNGGGTIADGSVSVRKLSTAAQAALAGQAFDHVANALDRGDQDSTADLEFIHTDDPDTIIGRITSWAVTLGDM